MQELKETAVIEFKSSEFEHSTLTYDKLKQRALTSLLARPSNKGITKQKLSRSTTNFAKTGWHGQGEGLGLGPVYILFQPDCATLQLVLLLAAPTKFFPWTNEYSQV